MSGLAERIERGEFSRGLVQGISEHTGAKLDDIDAILEWGDLNACHALMNELLPQWTVGYIKQDKTDFYTRWDVRLSHRSEDNFWSAQESRAKNQASAWLAAIIRAVESKEPHKCGRCGVDNPDHEDMDGCRDPECPEHY